MNLTNTQKTRLSFSSLPSDTDYPDLLALQLRSWRKIFQVGEGIVDRKQEKLYNIFQDYFPITDGRGNFNLEFLGYTISPPCYTPEECLEQGITYDVPLKVRFRLSCKDEDGTRVVEEEIYLANIPHMTPRGSFIFKGIERVVISQLQRSAGVFFSQTKHITGVNLYAAKIIPFVGAWIEFSIDMYNVMYVYLDRRKKIPVTLLLRAIGYGTDKEILQYFNLAESVKVEPQTLKDNKGRMLAGKLLRTWEEEFVDEETGEVISISRHEVVLERNTVLDDQAIDKILASNEENIMLLKEDMHNADFSFIYNTLQKDSTNSEKEAINYIYYQFRSAEPSDEQAARDFTKQLLFSPKRAFLGSIGRHCLNRKLGLDIPSDHLLLTPEDIVATITQFPALINGKRNAEDVDSLVNRVVQLSGDLLEQSLNRGIRLTAHNIKELLDAKNNEELRPFNVINGHYLLSSVHAFLGLDPNSQYMDQVNPLSEVEHKRRVTKLSKTLTRERAGFEMRDVHPTYHGRICPVATPEGLNIGLIGHFAVCAKLNSLGFIQTPYKKVTKGKVDLQSVNYLTAEEEDKQVIAQHTPAIDKVGKITVSKLNARDYRNEFMTVPSDQVHYISTKSDQSFAISTSLIPFIENTDASRATMGSNMQRQALPLLQTEAPVIGTGQEKRLAENARVLITAEEDGLVEYVDAYKIVVKRQVPKMFEEVSLVPTHKTYYLTRLRPTNQGTCIHHRPVVQKGDSIHKGQLLCEGYAISKGELALGRNLRVAFMSCRGYSFEDSVVISQRLVKDDVFTSIHIEEFTVDLHNTKLGPEEFTADIPNESEEAIRHLDEHGIVRIGKEVKEGDILVGKITPQSAENPSSESKLMAAIFGNLAGNVKNSSFKVPFSCQGTVIATKLLHGLKKGNTKAKETQQQTDFLEKDTLSKLNGLRTRAIDKAWSLLEGEKTKRIISLDGKKCVSSGKKFTKAIVENNLFPAHLGKEKIEMLSFRAFTSYAWTQNPSKNEKLAYLCNSYQTCYSQIKNNYTRERKKIEVGDELPPGVLKQAKVYIAKKCKIEVGDKLSGRHGNKGVIAKIMPEEDMPYHADGTRVDIILNPLSIPSRMNIGQLKEAVLGWAGEKLGLTYAIPAFEGPDIPRINKELKKANLPAFGRTILYDGRTGEPFEQQVTCGVIYMLKLNHLVQHKIHARSTGPYALITQQPLGGRSRNGGQKLGEMEGWALEAHGAAHIMQEMLTVKSDDVHGRQKTQEALYKGHNLPVPTTPESLKILEQQLAGLCINLHFR